MGSKRRCPGCGAKNDMDVRRCRVCTTVINMDAPEVARQELPQEAPSGPSLPEHFDAGVIDRQVQPARGRFEASSGLSGRIAAAQASKLGPTGADEPATHAPSPLPPPAADGESFDPNALFRDMD